MWKAAFCLQLAMVGRLLATSPPLGTLEATSKPTVALEDSAVVVSWSWTGPELVKLEEMVFVVTVENERGLYDSFEEKIVQRPFFYRIFSLEPLKKYTVGVRARHPLWKDGPVMKTTFTTTIDDWDMPHIKNVTSTRSQKFMNYTVSWKLDHKHKELSHFEIAMCTTRCDIKRASSTDSNVTFPVKFYTKFALRVAAIYDVRGVELFRRESPLYRGFSEVGPPEKIQNITHFYQWGNKLRIDWLPSNPPNGPVSYHEVFVYDPRNPFKVSGVNVTSGTSATLLAPLIHGNLYKIEIRAVNIDSRGVEHKSVASIFSLERILKPQIVKVELLQRKSRTVRFKIVPEHPQENIIYHVYSDLRGPAKLNKLNHDEFEAVGLRPVETFIISVHVCYPTKDVRTHTCEDVRYFNLTSNVEAPSPVMDLRLHETEDNGLILSWAPPQRPNGPVDKYKITVLEDQGLGPINIFVPTRQSWMRFNRTDAVQSPQFGVAAVNVDLDDENMEHIGQVSFITGNRFRGSIIPYVIGMFVLAFLLLYHCGVFTRASCRLQGNAADYRDDNLDWGEGDQELYEFGGA